MKLFQNLTSAFGENFFYEFLHVGLVQEDLIQQSHVYGRIIVLQTIFEKGSLKEHSYEIISKSDQQFQRRKVFSRIFS